MSAGLSRSRQARVFSPSLALLLASACISRPAAVGQTVHPASTMAANPSTAAETESTLVATLRDSLQAVLRRAYADSAFPGAYAVVGTHAGILAADSVGHLDWAPSPVPDEHTLWDLASLTKVTGMTTAIMQLYEDATEEALD